MRARVGAELDRVERTLKPGGWALDFGAFSRGPLTTGKVGAFLDIETRLNPSWSAFGHAEAAYDRARNELAHELLMGVRGRW